MEQRVEHIIFYFSGTGNSLYLALEIARNLNFSRLVPLLNFSGELPDQENIRTVGIVYPVHMNSLPAPVKRFLGKFRIPSDRFSYIVAATEDITERQGATFFNS